MKHCDGTPAKRNGLQYMEGTLPTVEADRLEEHYFSCPACLRVMRTLDAAAEEFAQMPAVAIPERRWSLIRWPVPAWSMAAVAALLVMGVLTYKRFQAGPPQPAVARNQAAQPVQAPAPTLPAAAPEPSQASSPVRLAQLADLALPPYMTPALRGERQDARFAAGMKKYAEGNCKGAIQALTQLPAEDAAHAAAFYAGACQMHLGDYAAAQALLRTVADAQNAPRQEAALYLLAQVSLAEDDAVAADGYLNRIIKLEGDLEARAQAELERIDALEKKKAATAHKLSHLN